MLKAPTIFVTNLNNCCNDVNSELIENNVIINNFFFSRQVIDKFLDDKPFFDNEKYFFTIDGIILNKVNLLNCYNCISFVDTIIKMYNEKGETFFDEFRGSFCGCFYDKNLKKMLIFTNQIGDHPFFYYFDNVKFICSTRVKKVIDCMKNNNINLSLNEKAIKYMLSFGYMIDDSTYAKEIKRLMPGCYIVLKDNKFEIKKYHIFDRMNVDTSKMSEDDIIDEIEKRFSNAIKLEYDKDIEYGYKHIVQLSGGYDSRMNNIVAFELGYKNILNYTYCQSDCLDEKVAKKISENLGNELWVRSMNNPYFFYDLDEIVEKSGGLSMYVGMTAGNRCIKELDFCNYGLLHTGLLGDQVLATYYRSANDLNNWNIYAACSTNMLDKLDFDYKSVMKSYKDNECFNLYTNGFLAGQNSLLMIQCKAEAISPFTDVDFLDFVMSINPKFRLKRNLYYKWIKKYHKKAGNYKWTGDGTKLNSFFHGINCLVVKIYLKLYRKLKINKIINLDVNNMNPFEYWYKNKPFLSKYFEIYFNNNISNDVLSQEYINYITDVFNQTSVMSKAQVLTCLSAINMYFGKTCS